MTDDEIRQYLADNGYPQHIVKGGREGLVARWAKFVAEVERGYEFGLEDYRNDLDVRGVISMLGLEDDERVAAADRRFASLLISPEVRVWESTAVNPFWDFGYPRNAGGDLLRDLRAEGLA